MDVKNVKIQLLNLDDIHPYDNNIKVHDDAQIKKIAKSITEFGFDQPIVVDKNHVIIKGHGRRLASIYLGLEKVPVLVRDDLTDEQVKAARLADNRVALGDIDVEGLHRELEQLNFDLKGIFDDKELEFLNAKDLSEMNLDAIVFDLDDAVAEQAGETLRHIEEADVRKTRIDKALGFKEIQGKDERIVSRFMAKAEAETELLGADAFVKFVEKIVKEGAEV